MKPCVGELHRRTGVTAGFGFVRFLSLRAFPVAHQPLPVAVFFGSRSFHLPVPGEVVNRGFLGLSLRPSLPADVLENSHKHFHVAKLRLTTASTILFTSPKIAESRSGTPRAEPQTAITGRRRRPRPGRAGKAHTECRPRAASWPGTICRPCIMPPACVTAVRARPITTVFPECMVQTCVVHLSEHGGRAGDLSSGSGGAV